MFEDEAIELADVAFFLAVWLGVTMAGLAGIAVWWWVHGD